MLGPSSAPLLEQSLEISLPLTALRLTWGQPPSAVQSSAARLSDRLSDCEARARLSQTCAASLRWTAEGGCPHAVSGNAISVCRTSCNSSASRTSGQASSPHLRDRRRIEFAHFFQHRLRQDAAHLHRARPPLFQRRIIEISVGIRIQNLVRELRRHRRVHRQATDSSLLNAAQQRPAARRCPSPR